MGKNKGKVSGLKLLPSPSACILHSVFLKYLCSFIWTLQSVAAFLGGFSPLPSFVPLFLLDVNQRQVQIFYFLLESSSGVTKY